MKKRQTSRTPKNKSRKKSVIIWLVIALTVSFIVLMLFLAVGEMTLISALKDKTYWQTCGVAIGSIVIAYLLLYRIDVSTVAMEENDLEDTEWLNIKKLKKNKEFYLTEWKNLHSSTDGIVINAEKKGKGIEILMTEHLHALMVGTTGSGKTTGFVDQNISMLSHTKNKPLLIITDPKKELYERHSMSLKEQGYKVSVLDLREPYTSMRWNPMQGLIRRVVELRELEKYLKAEDGKYCTEEKKYEAYSQVRIREQQLRDEIYENAKELVYTLCPIQNRDQPTWEQGARDLIFALVLGMCEDCVEGRIDEKQLILFNVYHNITKYCNADTTALKKYLIEDRGEYSKVRGLANTVLVTSDKTLTSYLSEVNAYMQQLSDDGILSLTSDNDLDMMALDEDANAIFIVVPDERVTRHGFVTLFISQLYKDLVEKANENVKSKATTSARLKRNAYFILDEFGNIPKIDKIDNFISVCRSRGIRLLFILQSLSQIKSVYGNGIGETLKSNCNVKMFIGSDDYDTRREFSELCGQKKVKSVSVNTHTESPASTSTSVTNRPLITMGMLERLNGEEKGEAVVSIRGYEPIMAKFTPSFKLKDFYFKGGEAKEDNRQTTLFEKSEVVFDIIQKAGESMEERAVNAIDEMDKDYIEYEKAKREKIAKLDDEWKKIETEIRGKMAGIAPVLKKEHREALKTVKLENVVHLLYSLEECYGNAISAKIIGTAKYIEDRIAMLKELQNSAENIK